MKKILRSDFGLLPLLVLMVSAALLLAVPQSARAAADDVTLTTDVIISVAGISLTVSGASTTIETITVGSDSFSFTMQSGSVLKVTSATGRVLTTNGSGYILTNTCTSGVSVLGFHSGGSVTITVVPSPDTACSGAATTATATTSGGGGGGGGGGPPAGLLGTSGGGTVTNTPSTSGTLTAEQKQTLIAQLTVQLKALMAQLVALMGSSSFARDLQVGSSGNDVKSLQAYLNSHGYPVSASGPGSVGNETTKFGAATKAALIKFQKGNGISPASGAFGPKTRAYISAHP